MTLNKLLGTGMGAWTVSFYLTHGPIVLAYLLFQCLTAGVFVWSMRKHLN